MHSLRTVLADTSMRFLVIEWCIKLPLRPPEVVWGPAVGVLRVAYVRPNYRFSQNFKTISGPNDAFESKEILGDKLLFFRAEHSGLLRVLENPKNLEMSGNLIFCHGKARKPGNVREFCHVRGRGKLRFSFARPPGSVVAQLRPLK